MTDNPYEPPPAGASVRGVLSGRREDLASVAKYQKGILVCILAYFALVACQFALPPELRLILVLGASALGITSTVFVFLLAIKVYGTGAGIVLGILTLVPCVGLIVLLLVNGKATAILKENGIRVGLLGANLSEI